MEYRLQEDKEFFPKHLILNGPLTDANYHLIKNQLQKSGQKQAGMDWRQVTSDQYYKMLVQLLSGGFCNNIQVPESLNMSREQKLAGRKLALIYLISNTLKVCDAPPVTQLMMSKTQQLMSETDGHCQTILSTVYSETDR